MTSGPLLVCSTCLQKCIGRNEDLLGAISSCGLFCFGLCSSKHESISPQSFLWTSSLLCFARELNRLPIGSLAKLLQSPLSMAKCSVFVHVFNWMVCVHLLLFLYGLLLWLLVFFVPKLLYKHQTMAFLSFEELPVTVFTNRMEKLQQLTLTVTLGRQDISIYKTSPCLTEQNFALKLSHISQLQLFLSGTLLSFFSHQWGSFRSPPDEFSRLMVLSSSSEKMKLFTVFFVVFLVVLSLAQLGHACGGAIPPLQLERLRVSPIRRPTK